MVTSLPVTLMENCLRESRLSLIRHCSRPIGDVPMVKECSTVGELHSCESFVRTSRVAIFAAREVYSAATEGEVACGEERDGRDDGDDRALALSAILSATRESARFSS